MGTRAVITFIDNHDTFHVYRHWDGNPEYVLGTIESAKEYAWELPRFEACDFAAAYVRAQKTGGGNIYLTKHYNAHGDLAYRYEVRLASTGRLDVQVFEHAVDASGGHWKDITESRTIEALGIFHPA